MTTKIERLCPEITDLAASIGQEVSYHGGDYFMRPCNFSLWDSRQLGPLTEENAEMSMLALRRMVRHVKPEQERPLSERLDEVARMLNESGWRPRVTAVVTTNAQDIGRMSHDSRGWRVSIDCVGRDRVMIDGHSGTVAEAISEAVRVALSEEVTT